MCAISCFWRVVDGLKNENILSFDRRVTVVIHPPQLLYPPDNGGQLFSQWQNKRQEFWTETVVANIWHGRLIAKSNVLCIFVLQYQFLWYQQAAESDACKHRDDQLDDRLAKQWDCVDIDFMSSWRWITSVWRWWTSAVSWDVWMTETDGIATSMTLSAYSANCS